MANWKEVLTQPLLKTDSARSGLLVVAGGYVLYSAYDMVRQVLADQTDTSKVPAFAAAGVLAIGGIGIMVYAVRRWIAAYKKEKAELESQETTEE